MMRIAFLIISNWAVIVLTAQQKKESIPDSSLMMEAVEVKAIRAGDNAPFSKTNISKPDIEKNNLGQDLPFLLNQTPSVVINSDAGNGVGYTGIRIRGTDASRINVTLNGIPYNDAESQGTFFVDLPDFSSSVNSIQVQRGVGTSSNGAGSFGATVNISTNEVITKPYTELNNSFGSFNTWKNTLKAGTGLLGNHFTADVRLSRINSDGYIDRAISNLKSFYFSTAYLTKKSSLRFNIFSGKEKTYQAWYGASETDLTANRTVNYAGTEKPGTPYDNETDNYTQTHYQLFFNHALNAKFKFNAALFYIKGKGYYEQYKADQLYADYGITEPTEDNIVVTNSNMVRRLWLDNDFYGTVFSAFYKKNKTEFTLGGGYNKYEGNHFGDVIWAEKGLPSAANWYNLDAFKNDFNIFFKQQTILSGYWNLFYDLQFRNVTYNINGFRDNPSLIINNNYNFFNPKVGISYKKNGFFLYASQSIGSKEPNRDDFEAGASQIPKPEKLYDTELGAEYYGSNYKLGATLYYMNYKDQLVLTGKINDVGAYTRTNIPNSFRAGIELTAAYKFNTKFSISGNLSFSKNKVKNFSEYIDDYDAGNQKINTYSEPDIAYSPAIVSGISFNYSPFKNFEISLLSKYVSKQYLDNTQNNDRKLNAFFVQDARFVYSFSKGFLKKASLLLQANNLLNKKYEPNGYTYSYISGGAQTTENYYFPMAGINFMFGINLKF